MEEQVSEHHVTRFGTPRAETTTLMRQEPNIQWYWLQPLMDIKTPEWPKKSSPSYK